VKGWILLHHWHGWIQDFVLAEGDFYL